MTKPRRRLDITHNQWKKLSKAIRARDNYQCQLRLAGCTQTATATDHIIPHSRGGLSIETNLRATCKNCNSRRGNKIDYEVPPSRIW